MITIFPEHRQQIQLHAEQVYPEECCGLLIGTVDGDGKIILEVREAENSWKTDGWEQFSERAGSKRNRFSISPQVLLQVQKETRERNLGIVGIYHSHPDCPAFPSEFDRAIAWAGYSYLIISVRQGQAVDLKSWRLAENCQFQAEVIRLNVKHNFSHIL